MPATRDRFIKMGMSQLLNPELAEGEKQGKKVSFVQRKDKLDIDDIDGVRVTQKGYRAMTGRDNLDLTDLKVARPVALK